MVGGETSMSRICVRMSKPYPHRSLSSRDGMAIRRRILLALSCAESESFEMHMPKGLAGNWRPGSGTGIISPDWPRPPVFS